MQMGKYDSTARVATKKGKIMGFFPNSLKQLPNSKELEENVFCEPGVTAEKLVGIKLLAENTDTEEEFYFDLGNYYQLLDNMDVAWQVGDKVELTYEVNDNGLYLCLNGMKINEDSVNEESKASQDERELTPSEIVRQAINQNTKNEILKTKQRDVELVLPPDGQASMEGKIMDSQNTSFSNEPPKNPKEMREDLAKLVPSQEWNDFINETSVSLRDKIHEQVNEGFSGESLKGLSQYSHIYSGGLNAAPSKQEDKLPDEIDL
jgi:hypothetical protein